MLESLEKALLVSPENTALRFTLVKAYFEESRFARAYELVNESYVENYGDDELNLLAANVCLVNGSLEQSLRLLQSKHPKVLLLKAKVLFAMDDFGQAKEAYLQAIQKSPSLEDIEFESKLNVENSQKPLENQVKLRVISNDDTDDIEITRIIQPKQENVTFAEVGGLEQVKKQIRRKIITPFIKPSLFNRFRKKVGGGILLYGPPGCGKTLLARATAGECNAEFFNVAISDILDMYIGESERKLHAVFEQARQKAPSVLFFDEIEALAAKRQHTREATSSKLVSQFLSELDGFTQNNQGVLVLGATNVPWALDPAFRRPGRFDRVVFIAPPDREARAKILKELLSNRPGGDSLDTVKISKLTRGFSGADLMNLVESAVDEAIEESINSEEEIPLNKNHLDEALKTTKPTTLEWLTMARNYARYANDAGQYDEVIDFLKKHGK